MMRQTQVTAMAIDSDLTQASHEVTAMASDGDVPSLTCLTAPSHHISVLTFMSSTFSVTTISPSHSLSVSYWVSFLWLP